MARKNNNQVSTAELCDLLSISAGRLSQLISAGVIDRTARNSFDAKRAVAAYVAHRVAGAVRELGGDGGSLTTARARYATHKAKLAQLDVLEREAQLVPIDQIETA